MVGGDMSNSNSITFSACGNRSIYSCSYNSIITYENAFLASPFFPKLIMLIFGCLVLMFHEAATIFTSTGKEGEGGHHHISFCVVLLANCPRECPSTDLVSTWGPSCCGNSHLCILADWSLVSHSRQWPPPDLSRCTGINTWEKQDLDSV